jgi:transposase
VIHCICGDSKYDRDHLRYPSDLTDDEWGYVEPLIPPAKTGGGKRRTGMRAVMNGVMYILTGCQWRYLPKDFPPRGTDDYFTWWNCDGPLDRIHHRLYVECREKLEREANLTIPLISNEPVNIGEKRLLAQELAEFFHERPQSRLLHGWNELVMHAALTEQGMCSPLGGAEKGGLYRSARV